MIKICISVTSHALDPPVTNCHTFSDLPPLERDVLYGRPLSISWRFSIPSLSLPLDFVRVSSLWSMYLHPFGRPFTYSLLGEFPGLELALVSRYCGPRGGTGCAWSRNLDPDLCRGRGRILDLAM